MENLRRDHRHSSKNRRSRVAAWSALTILALALLWMMSLLLNERQRNGQLSNRLIQMESEIQGVARRMSAVLPASAESRWTSAPEGMNSGWIVRVYTPPKIGSKSLPEEDLGWFVLDQQAFTLNTHAYHGISHQTPLAYRMNSYLNVSGSGRFQFGLRMRFASPHQDSKRPIEPPRCEARLNIANQQVVAEHVNFTRQSTAEATLVGSIDLEPALHPAEAILFCDEALPESARHVTFSVVLRPPGATTFKEAEADFVHVTQRRSSSRPEIPVNQLEAANLATPVRVNYPDS